MIEKTTGPVDRRPDVLIAELSHRWLNGLQVIEAGLHLCRWDCGASATVRRTLADLCDQVQAMAALHRRLSARRAADVDLERQCRALCTDTLRSFGRGDIALAVSAIDAAITPRSEQRLALLLVELVTNALKHGRPSETGAAMSIQLRFAVDRELELVVSDNFGSPPFDAAPVPAFAATLAAELGGALHISCRPFYCTRVRFPVQRP
jgi:two-component sensor histidine kinase